MRERGQAAVRQRPQSERDEAEHYREYADQLRALAEVEPTGSLHDSLMALAREYEQLAARCG